MKKYLLSVIVIAIVGGGLNMNNYTSLAGDDYPGSLSPEIDKVQV